jgi:uncharacterized protein YkwD
MNAQQVVIAPQRRKRRRVGIFLLGVAPIVLAATAGSLATSVIPVAEPAPLALSAGVGVAGVVKGAPTASAATPSVVAAADAAFNADGHTVNVTPSGAQEADPAVAATSPASASAPQTSAPKSSSSNSSEPSSPKVSAPKPKTASEPKAEPKPSASYTSYCAAPATPYSASSNDIKALLTAANKERARIGAGSLSWSSSLASAAQSWSSSMASKDDKTDAPYDALAHNPNRPGGENVAVSYSDAGMSKSRAMGKAHSRWMYSNGHCLNIMNPSYSSMGAGTAQTADGTTWYTTANFR